MLIHEQSGEHGVALAWVRAAQPPPPVIPLLPRSHVMPPTCTPTFLLMPDARSETGDAVEMPCLQPAAEFSSRSEADAD